MERPILFSPRSLRFGSRFLCVSALASTLLLQSKGFAAETYKWSVQYLIDNSQSVFGKSQAVYPRSNRAIALSPNGKKLYACYLHSFNQGGEVRRISLDQSGFEEATERVLPGILAKAVATDPEGRVYLAEADQIAVYDANLRRLELEIDLPGCEGLALAREGSTLALYATNRKLGILYRYAIESTGPNLLNATPKGLEKDGELKIPEAKDLRGIAVDKKGRIWMADLAGNKIFRVNNDGKGLVSKALSSPFGLSFDGDRCFITQYRECQITITDLEINELGTLKIPWEDLALSVRGNNHLGALTGIVMIPGKGFLVSNEGGQTADQRSTYGKEDDYSGTINGRFFTDLKADDNEPILQALREIPAPPAH